MNFKILPPLPRQHLVAQPIGVTVHSHCLENFEDLLQRHVGEELVAVDCEKYIFSRTPTYICTYICLASLLLSHLMLYLFVRVINNFKIINSLSFFLSLSLILSLFLLLFRFLFLSISSTRSGTHTQFIILISIQIYCKLSMRSP